LSRAVGIRRAFFSYCLAHFAADNAIETLRSIFLFSIFRQPLQEGEKKKWIKKKKKKGRKANRKNMVAVVRLPAPSQLAIGGVADLGRSIGRGEHPRGRKADPSGVESVRPLFDLEA
jgi:hypothetical protein